MREAPVVNVTLRKGVGADRRVDFRDRLIAFEFEDNDSRADKCTLTLDNFDLRWLDDETFRKGQRLDVSWGYVGNLTEPQAVIVKRVHGGAVIKIECHSVGVGLNQEKRTAAFNNVRRSDVARKIAGDNGFSGDRLHVEDTKEEFETINQAAETDAALCKRLAKKEGFTFYVDSTGFHWHDSNYDAAPTHVLIYYTDEGRGDILKFKMDSDMTRMPGRVQVKGMDPKTKKAFDKSGSDADTDRTELAGQIEVIDPQTGATDLIKRRIAQSTVRHTSAATETDAKREADSRWKRSSRRRIKLGLDIVGDPTIKAKTTIKVKGLGEYLSGLYYVKVVKTKIGGGYTASLALRRGGPTKVAGGQGDDAGGTKNRKKPPPKDELFEKTNEATGEITFHRRPIKGGT